jgi:hypothetical protein
MRVIPQLMKEQPPSMTISRLCEQLLKLPEDFIRQPSLFGTTLLDVHCVMWSALFTLQFSSDSDTAQPSAIRRSTPILHNAATKARLPDFAPTAGHLPTFNIRVSSIKTNNRLSRIQLTFTHNLGRAVTTSTTTATTTSLSVIDCFQIPILLVVVDTSLAERYCADNNSSNNGGMTVCSASVNWVSSRCSNLDADDDTAQHGGSRPSSQSRSHRCRLEPTATAFSQCVGVFHHSPSAVPSIPSLHSQAMNASPMQCVLLPHPRWAWAAASGLVSLSSGGDCVNTEKATTEVPRASGTDVCKQFVLSRFLAAASPDAVLPPHAAEGCDDHQWAGILKFLRGDTC